MNPVTTTALVVAAVTLAGVAYIWHLQRELAAANASIRALLARNRTATNMAGRWEHYANGLEHQLAETADYLHEARRDALVARKASRMQRADFLIHTASHDVTALERLVNGTPELETPRSAFTTQQMLALTAGERSDA